MRKKIVHAMCVYVCVSVSRLVASSPRMRILVSCRRCPYVSAWHACVWCSHAIGAAPCHCTHVTCPHIRIRIRIRIRVSNGAGRHVSVIHTGAGAGACAGDRHQPRAQVADREADTVRDAQKAVQHMTCTCFRHVSYTSRPTHLPRTHTHAHTCMCMPSSCIIHPSNPTPSLHTPPTPTQTQTRTDSHTSTQDHAHTHSHTQSHTIQS